MDNLEHGSCADFGSPETVWFSGQFLWLFQKGVLKRTVGNLEQCVGNLEQSLGYLE